MTTTTIEGNIKVTKAFHGEDLRKVAKGLLFEITDEREINNRMDWLECMDSPKDREKMALDDFNEALELAVQDSSNPYEFHYDDMNLSIVKL